MTIKVRKTRGKALPSAQAPPTPASNPLISDAKLKQLYSSMLECRILAERASQLRLSSAKSMRRLVREGAVVAMCIDLRREDWVAPLQTDLLLKFLKGMPLTSILGEQRQEREPRKATTNPLTTAENDYSAFHIISPAANPAAQLNLASGVALALQTIQKSNVVVAFCGDTSGSGQRWQEALTFAGKKCLPLLVVVDVRASTKATAKLANSLTTLDGAGSVCDVPVIPVDADDVVALYRVAYESIHKARHGGGPTLIQAVSFPVPPKSKGANAHSASPSDAIAKMEDYLSGKGLFSSAWKQKLNDSFMNNVDSALETSVKARLLSRK